MTTAARQDSNHDTKTSHAADGIFSLPGMNPLCLPPYTHVHPHPHTERGRFNNGTKQAGSVWRSGGLPTYLQQPLCHADAVLCCSPSNVLDLLHGRQLAVHGDMLLLCKDLVIQLELCVWCVVCGETITRQTTQSNSLVAFPPPPSSLLLPPNWLCGGGRMNTAGALPCLFAAEHSSICICMNRLAR